MKIIELLALKYNKKLKDGFRFVYKDNVYKYYSLYDTIVHCDTNNQMGHYWLLENILEDEIEVITPELVDTEE